MIAEFEFHSVEGMRLDACLIRHLQSLKPEERIAVFGSDYMPSREKAANWIEQGCISVAGRLRTKPAYRPKDGALIQARVAMEGRPGSLKAESEVPFTIVFEDNDVIVVDKPAGVVVHPGAGRTEGTLVNGLLQHLGESFLHVGSAGRPGIVHRLDRGTSGLLVAAKTEASYQALIKQFQPPRKVKRTYLALCTATPKGKGKNGEISLPIMRSPAVRTKMAVARSGGKEAVTFWKVHEALRHGVLLELTLGTGRTHQIRVHLSSCGAPIVGDPVYGLSWKMFSPLLRKPVLDLGRQALHAWKLSFMHPVTEKELHFVSEMPEDMKTLVKAFRGE